MVSDEALVRGLLALIPRSVVKGMQMKLHAIEILQGDLLLASLRIPAGLGCLGCALLDLIDDLLLISLEGVSSKLEVFLIAFEG
jgi:hypothetical protein